MLSPFKVALCLFYEARKEVIFYSWDIRSPLEQCIKKQKTLQRIHSVASLYVTRSRQEADLGLAGERPSVGSMESSQEVRFLCERTRLLRKDLLLLEADQQSVQIFQGDVSVLRFNLIQSFYGQIGALKTSLIDAFYFANSSSVSL